MEERKIIAYHEAGHAFMAFIKKVRIVKVSIVPSERQGSLGHLIASNKIGSNPEDENFKSKYRTRLENFCMVAMAGMISEYILTGIKNWEGVYQDQEYVNYLLSLLTYSQREFSLYRDLLWVRTETILRTKDHWHMIENLANYLLTENSVISGRKAKEILRNSNPRLIKENISSVVCSLNKRG